MQTKLLKYNLPIFVKITRIQHYKLILIENYYTCISVEGLNILKVL